TEPSPSGQGAAHARSTTVVPSRTRSVHGAQRSRGARAGADVRSDLEREPGLCRRQSGQPERRQLPGELVDAGENPATHNGGPGSGMPWTIIGSCSGPGGCTVIPSVPSGLSASNVTSSSVTLSWSASSAGPGCTIQYRVFQNGTEVASVSGTSVTISNLSAGTTYRYS